jgi:sugar phosphate isomerase/epimerase
MSIPGTIWLSMWGAGERPSDADFAAVRDCGVIHGVEIWTEHPHAEWEVQRAAECGLQVGIHLPFHDLNPVSDDPVVAERALQRNREWLRHLSGFGGVHAVLHGGYAASAADRGAKVPRLPAPISSGRSTSARRCTSTCCSAVRYPRDDGRRQLVAEQARCRRP